MTIEVPSLYARGTRVSIDPWGPNPLLEDARQSVPHLVTTASAERPVPTMFMSGDLPPFTSSGIEPEVLNRFPWQSRHMAATTPDRESVLALLEQYASDPLWRFEHQGLEEYIVRMRDWLSGNGLAPHQLNQDSADDNYDALFGAEDRAIAALKDRQDQIAAAQHEHQQRMADIQQQASLGRGSR